MGTLSGALRTLSAALSTLPAALRTLSAALRTLSAALSTLSATLSTLPAALSTLFVALSTLSAALSTLSAALSCRFVGYGLAPTATRIDIRIAGSARRDTGWRRRFTPGLLLLERTGRSDDLPRIDDEPQCTRDTGLDRRIRGLTSQYRK